MYLRTHTAPDNDPYKGCWLKLSDSGSGQVPASWNRTSGSAPNAFLARMLYSVNKSTTESSATTFVEMSDELTYALVSI